jgi:hypothetical protein
MTASMSCAATDAGAAIATPAAATASTGAAVAAPTAARAAATRTSSTARFAVVVSAAATTVTAGATIVVAEPAFAARVVSLLLTLELLFQVRQKPLAERKSESATKLHAHLQEIAALVLIRHLPLIQ